MHKRLDLGNEHGGDVGTDDRAHAADDYDDEGVGDHGEVHAEIGRLARDLQRAAEPGEHRAQGEDRREQHRLIDAKRADHVAILGRRAHQAAETRAREHCVQHDENGRRDDDQESVVARHAATEHFDGAAQARGARPEQIFRSPQPQRRIVDDENQREGGKELKQLRRDVDAAQQHDLDQRAENADDKRCGDDAAPEADRAAHRRRQRNGDIGAQHVERAMRDIDDAGDAEDQGKSGGDKKQAGRRGQTVDGLKRKPFQFIAGRYQSLATASSSARLSLWLVRAGPRQRQPQPWGGCVNSGGCCCEFASVISVPPWPSATATKLPAM